jgi:DNA-binding NtrC family response regulator
MLETLQGEIVGASTEACLVRRFVETAAHGTTPVTLLGEQGSGKELVARLIHQGSQCSKGPFLMVDCSLFYERELKRELFGYVSAGARSKSRKGLLEFASSGTCYLSRIEELSPGIQSSLLELIEIGRFSRLGDGKQIASDVRLVVSSPKNLAGFVNAGLFDARLFEQLSRLSLRLPALRERRDDVPAIVEHVSSVYAAGHAGLVRPLFAAESLQAMQAYPWPGNFDELEKEVMRLLESATGTIRPAARRPGGPQSDRGARRLHPRVPRPEPARPELRRAGPCRGGFRANARGEPAGLDGGALMPRKSNSREATHGR